MVQALFAANERWFLNEKGSVRAVDSMRAKPGGFSEAASRLLGCPGQDAEALAGSVSRYKELLAKARESCVHEVQYRELPGSENFNCVIYRDNVCGRVDLKPALQEAKSLYISVSSTDSPGRVVDHYPHMGSPASSAKPLTLGGQTIA